MKFKNSVPCPPGPHVAGALSFPILGNSTSLFTGKLVLEAAAWPVANSGSAFLPEPSPS